MNRLLIVLLVLLSVPCMAQFTVTQSNFPRPAAFIDTVLSTNEANIPLPTEGADQFWDFSGLTSSNTSLSTHTDASASPVFIGALNSYQDSIDFSGFAVPVTIFEAIDAGGWHNLGKSVSEISYPLELLTLNPSDTLTFVNRNDIFIGRINPVRFPCSFQVQWSGTQVERTDFSLTLSSASLIQEPGFRKRVVTDDREVVGYGKMLIPDFGGGVTDTMDVLQIRVYHETVDSFFVSGSPASNGVLTALGLSQGNIVRDTSYVFYRADYSGSVLELNVLNDTIGAAFFRPQADNVLSSGLLERRFTDMKYYPNPISAGQRLNIVMDENQSGSHQAIMLDMLGRQIAISTLANQTNTQFEIPVSTQPGMYIVLITDETGLPISRMKLQVR